MFWKFSSWCVWNIKYLIQWIDMVLEMKVNWNGSVTSGLPASVLLPLIQTLDYGCYLPQVLSRSPLFLQNSLCPFIFFPLLSLLKQFGFLWFRPKFKVYSRKLLGGECSLKLDFKPLTRSPHFAPTLVLSVFQIRYPMITFLSIALSLRHFGVNCSF